MKLASQHYGGILKKFLIGAALVGSLFAGIVVVAAPANGSHDAIEDHCPNHNGNPAKDESGSDDNNLVPAAGTRICVKAGNENSSGGATGIITADGVKTLRQYLAAAGIVDGGGELGRNVSYWVTYPPLLEAFICFNGQIVVLTNEVQAALNLAVTAYLAANPGAVQVASREATCVVTTTTTIPPTTTTTVPPTTTTTAPPVTTTTAPPVVTTTVPLPTRVTCESIGRTNFPTTDRNLDADGDGIGCEADIGTFEPGEDGVHGGPASLPHTGNGGWLFWVGLGLLVSGAAAWGMGTYLRGRSIAEDANL